MREIKFRAYFPNEARMGKKTMRENVHSAHEGQNLNDFIKEIQKIGIILMQYTGLKDKNGKEIYEGDIIHASLRIREVIFEGGCFLVAIGNGNTYLHALDNIEIIGNIYENPELINK